MPTTSDLLCSSDVERQWPSTTGGNGVGCYDEEAVRVDYRRIRSVCSGLWMPLLSERPARGGEGSLLVR